MLKTGEKFCSALAALPTDKSSYNQAPTVDLRPPVSKLYIVANRSRQPHQNLTRCDVHVPNLRLFKAAKKQHTRRPFCGRLPRGEIVFHQKRTNQARHHCGNILTFWMDKPLKEIPSSTTPRTRRATQVYRMQSCNAIREASPSRRAVP